jgi:HTH-type transcriptional regulator / antitoxin HigA
MSVPVEIGRLLPAWKRFREATDIGPIRDEAHYLRMVETLEALLDETVGDEHHPAMGLVDSVGDLIADYEAGEPPLPAASGVETLAFLIEQHGLGPADLPEIGDEGKVQEVLTERRDLDIRQLRALGQRFGVSPGTFV